MSFLDKSYSSVVSAKRRKGMWFLVDVSYANIRVSSSMHQIRSLASERLGFIENRCFVVSYRKEGWTL